MDLSIIILTLNNRDILEECIDSVKKFTKDISYEIIVSDNGSVDGTRQFIRTKHPEIALIENEKNFGFSVANNKGLKAAKGRYSMLLNDDTYLKEDAFSKIVRFMDNEPDVGICGPKLLNIDGSVQRQGSILSSIKWNSTKPIEVDFVLGACMFIRMAVLGKIGLLDENLFFYNDDLDICKRAKSAGYKVVYFPDAEIYHYGGYSSKKSPNKRYIIEGFRGGLYFCKKHYAPLIYQIYRAIILLVMPIFAVLSLGNRVKSSAYLEIFTIALKQQIVNRA
jgi:hypothetical protein